MADSSGSLHESATVSARPIEGDRMADRSLPRSCLRRLRAAVPLFVIDEKEQREWDVRRVTREHIRGGGAASAA
jgi:hypothetical protein